MSRTASIIFYSIVAALGLFATIYMIWIDGDHDGGSNLGIRISEVLLIVAAAAAILSAIVTFSYNPKAGIRIIILLAAMLAIYFIASSMSDGSVAQKFIDAEKGVTAAISKRVDGGLVLLYVLGIVAVLAAIFSEFSGLFRKN